VVDPRQWAGNPIFSKHRKAITANDAGCCDELASRDKIQPALCPGVTPWRFPYDIAQGWSTSKLLGGLNAPRTLAFDVAGNLLILQSGFGVTIHTLGGDGCILTTKVLIPGTFLNHGLAVGPDGLYLYASSPTTAWRWPYQPWVQAVGDPIVVVYGMFDGGHATRTLVLAPQDPNVLLVSHGSDGNWDYAAGTISTERAVVKAFNMSVVPPGGFAWATGGWQMGWGLRMAYRSIATACFGVWKTLVT
jgi:hypothetical protein